MMVQSAYRWQKKHGSILQPVCDADWLPQHFDPLQGFSIFNLIFFYPKHQTFILQQNRFHAYASLATMHMSTGSAWQHLIQISQVIWIMTFTHLSLTKTSITNVISWNWLTGGAPKENFSSTLSCLRRIQNFLIDQEEVNLPTKHIPTR